MRIMSARVKKYIVLISASFLFLQVETEKKHFLFVHLDFVTYWHGVRKIIAYFFTKFMQRLLYLRTDFVPKEVAKKKAKNR